MVQAQSAAKDVLSIIQERGGVNPFMMKPDELPENDEEMQLHMQLKYKPAIEIAEEEVIATGWDRSAYTGTRARSDSRHRSHPGAVTES